MYFNALESQSILDTETVSLIYLSNQACWNSQSPFKTQNRLPKQTQSKCFKTVNVSTHSRADIHKSNQPPLETNPANESPITVTSTDLPIVMAEPVEAQIDPNEKML